MKNKKLWIKIISGTAALAMVLCLGITAIAAATDSGAPSSDLPSSAISSVPNSLAPSSSSSQTSSGSSSLAGSADSSSVTSLPESEPQTGFVYSEQPTSLVEVNLQGLEDGSWQMPRWKQMIDPAFIPEGFIQVQRTDDKTGAVYWTLEILAAPKLEAITAAASFTVSDFAGLKDAVAQAASGDVIEITDPIYFDDSINIQAGRSLSFVSSSAGAVSLIVNTANTRHFNTLGDNVALTFQNIILDGSNTGGGIDGNGALQINGGTFQNISAEYGAINDYYPLELNNITFQHIRSSNSGSAVQSHTTLTIRDSVFSDVGSINQDTGPSGGAIVFSGETASITNTQFINCFIEGPGVSGSGGGAISMESWHSEPNLILTNTIFTNCYAYGNSGISAHGGALQTNANITMTGGGFINCWATGFGGSICNNYLNYDTIWKFSGVSFKETQNPTLQNGTQLAGGTAWDGGAIYFAGSLSSIQVALEMENSTFDGLNGKYNGAVMYLENINTVTLDKISVDSNGLLDPYSNHGIIAVNNYNLLDPTVKVTNSSFTGNFGNSLRYSGFGVVEVQDSIFTENQIKSAISIGGKQGENGTPTTKATISNTQFTDNRSDLNGTVESYFGEVELIINNGSVFKNNHSTYGAGIFIASKGTLAIENSSFVDNYAKFGGALYTLVGTIIRNSEFTGNQALNYGGAIYADNVTAQAVHLEGCSLIGNTATDGGAIYNSYLDNTYVDANTKFKDNKSAQAYILDDPNDIALHNNRIFTSQFSQMYENGPTFLYGYNNYDIFYTLSPPVVFKTVTFDPMNGSDTFTQTAIQDQNVVRPDDPIKSGFVFAYWNTSADASGTVWDFDTMTVANDMTLYAQYEIATVTITFESNGGSPVPSITADSGSLIQEPAAPVRNEFDFQGWYRDSAFITQWNFGADTVAENITLYAKWTAVEPPPGSSSSSPVPPPSSSAPAPPPSASSTAPPASSSLAPPISASSTTPVSASSRPAASSSSIPVASTSSRPPATPSSAAPAGSANTSSSAPVVPSAATEEPTPPSEIAVSSTTPATPVSNAEQNRQRREEIRSQMIEAGIPTVQLGRTQVPLFGGGERFVWSLLSLVLMVASVATCLVVTIKLLLARWERLDEKHPVHKFVAIAIGVVSLISFFILYNISGVMVLMDVKTILFALLLAGELAALIIARLQSKPEAEV